jgi:hypothetical protein
MKPPLGDLDCNQVKLAAQTSLPSLVDSGPNKNSLPNRRRVLFYRGSEQQMAEIIQACL